MHEVSLNKSLGKPDFMPNRQFAWKCPKPSFRWFPTNSEVHGGRAFQRSAESRQYKITGRIDAIADDGTLIDWKSSPGPAELKRYPDLWQWRCYFALFGGRQFQYHHFRMEDRENGWDIMEHQVVTLECPPTLLEDLLDFAEELRGFVEDCAELGLLTLKNGRIQRKPRKTKKTKEAPPQ